MMYQIAPTFEIYADIKTLPSRLRIIAMQLGMKMESVQQKSDISSAQDNNRQREGPEGSPAESNSSATATTATNTSITPISRRETNFATQRCQQLRRKLGISKYKEVVQLVSEVIQFRRRFNASSANNCGLNHNRQRRNGLGHDSQDTNPSIRTPRLGSPPQPQKEELRLSPEVKSMYFHTRLVEAMKSVGAQGTTSLQISRVDNVNWDELIDEAKCNLANVKDVQYELLCRGSCC
jgi:hypothetical protein